MKSVYGILYINYRNCYLSLVCSDFWERESERKAYSLNLSNLNFDTLVILTLNSRYTCYNLHFITSHFETMWLKLYIFCHGHCKMKPITSVQVFSKQRERESTHRHWDTSAWFKQLLYTRSTQLFTSYTKCMAKT